MALTFGSTGEIAIVVLIALRPQVPLSLYLYILMLSPPHIKPYKTLWSVEN